APIGEAPKSHGFEDQVLHRTGRVLARFDRNVETHRQRLSSAAERMRLYRERRRRGLSCVKVQLRRTEVDALIARGLLEPAERKDRSAVAAALHRYLDANPIAGRR